MLPELQYVVDQIKARNRQGNPATAVQTSAPPETVYTLRQQLQRGIVNAGIKYRVDEDDLALACDELGVDFHLLTAELATWL